MAEPLIFWPLAQSRWPTEATPIGNGAMAPSYLLSQAPAARLCGRLAGLANALERAFGDGICLQSGKKLRHGVWARKIIGIALAPSYLRALRGQTLGNRSCLQWAVVDFAGTGRTWTPSQLHIGAAFSRHKERLRA